MNENPTPAPDPLENPGTPSDPLDSVSASPPPPPPAPAPTGTSFGGNMDANQWAMLLHLSQLAGVAVPGLGLAAPIVIWQIQKDRFPALDAHGKMVTNWIISLLIYSVVASVLSAITCGVGVLLFIPIAILAILFPILGSLKARDGILWKYPLTITFLK